MSWPSLLLGLSILAGLGAFAHLGPLHANPLPCAVGLGAASLAWMAAVGLAARGERAFGSAPGLAFVLVVAVLMRIVAFAGEPELSDDVYRYVWEGEVVLAGKSPYAHAPDDPALADVAARIPDVRARLNNPDISAAYPPLAQYVHAGLVRIAHRAGPAPGLRGVRAMRVFYGACDLALIPLLVLLLRRRGRPVGLVVAWAWSPLAAVEFAGSGHFDSLALLLLFLGIERFTRPRASGGSLLGLGLCTAGALVKVLPLLALPFALRARAEAGQEREEGGTRIRRVAAGAGCVLGLVALGYAPILLLDGGASGLFAGLGQYGRRWEGGSLVFRFVDDMVRSFDLPFGLDPQLTGRRLVGLAWLACAAWAWTRRLELVSACGVCIAAFLVFSPTLHPWYVTWILPFVALRPRPAWVWLAGSAFVLYAPLPGWAAGREWVEPAWVWPVLAIPFLVLLVADAMNARSRP